MNVTHDLGNIKGKTLWIYALSFTLYLYKIGENVCVSFMCVDMDIST